MLRLYSILDSESEKCFNDLAALAASICETPMSAITLIDDNRQWFKAKVGISAKETSRDVAFCAHAILQNDVLVVPDAKKDERFLDNPYVTEESGIRFYAGAPLQVAGKYNLGTLCVVDTQPRVLNEHQLAALQILRDAVMTQLEMRKAAETIKTLESLLPICAWCNNVRSEDGAWKTVTEFLSKSDQVTHGICPKCATTFFEEGRDRPSCH